MICSICDEVSQVPTGTRIPTAFINTLWDRDSKAAVSVNLICRRRAARLPPKRMVAGLRNQLLFPVNKFPVPCNHPNL